MSADNLPDAGPCTWCQHGQWSHKRGRAGCREADCGCAKYEVDPAAERAEKKRVLTAVAEVCEGQAADARRELAELRTDEPAAVPVTPAESADLLGGALDLTRRQLEQVTRERDELKAELDQVRAQAKRDRDEAIHADITAATKVLLRYDAQQCNTCGARYTVPVEHPHPLTPVTVLVVRREAP